ncbi:hypothetical protein BSKO_07914 [Bryopsis sp. KO-2023]|nr:hypothetical protein BSKO_07914 [Bryopsis sp. KO-2023]
MSSPVIDALRVLVDDLCSQGCYFHALRALEALCTVDALPEVCADAHLRLSELLVEHTNNLREAKLHASRAQLMVKDLPGGLLLKCRVANQLGICHSLLGENKHRKQAFLKGLELCKDAILIMDTVAIHEWFCQFSIEVSDAYASEGVREKAIEHLQNGYNHAAEKQLEELKILFQLRRVQLLALSLDCSESEGVLSDLFKSLESPPTTVSPPFLNQAKLHALILRILLAQKQGCLISFTQKMVAVPAVEGRKSKKVPAIINEMMELFCEVSAQPPAYKLMPWPAIKSIISLLSAILLRHQGKVDLAMEHTTTGIDTVSQELMKLGLGEDGKKCREGESRTAWRAGQYLLPWYLLLECKAQIMLLSCDFQGAQAVILEVLGLVDNWPSLGVAVRSGAHMLIGLYLSSVGCCSMAISHFCTVVDSNVNPMQGAIARVCCALAELNTESSDAVGKGIDALGSYYTNANVEHLGDCEKAALHLASGLLHDHHGNQSEAKTRVSRALKLAHKKAGNHELICHSLNCLSSMQLDCGDVDGAQQMLTSCYTLSKQANDLVAFLGSLTVMEELYSVKHMKDRLEGMRAYKGPKEVALSESVNAAVECDGHEFIMKWGLDSMG